MVKGDKIVLFIIILVSLGLFFVTTRPPKEGTSKYISVQIAGKEVDKIPLKEGQEKKSYDYKTRLGKNTLLVEDGKCTMVHADCKDQICIHMAPVSQVGETIICLPHKFLVEVKSQEKSPEDIDFLLR